jgi:hemerythrin-like domain-containing protein
LRQRKEESGSFRYTQTIKQGFTQEKKEAEMKATNVLSEEHRVIERVLNSLETGAQRLASGQPMPPEFFISATDFIKGFADGCHHRKEEGVLFIRMEAQGVPVQGGPLGVMLAEHELGRQYTRALRAAAQDMQSGDESTVEKAVPCVVQSAQDYVALLRQHIYKEDHVLFPMADRVIPADQYDSVWEGFEHVEHEETGEGVHEKYLALAESLEDLIAA